MRKILIIFILQIVIFGCKKDESFPLSGNNKSLTVSFFITGAYTTGRDTLYIFENQKKVYYGIESWFPEKRLSFSADTSYQMTKNEWSNFQNVLKLNSLYSLDSLYERPESYPPVSKDAGQFNLILNSDLGTKHIVYEQGGFEGITDLKNIHTYLFAKRKSFFEFGSRKVNEWRAK